MDRFPLESARCQDFIILILDGQDRPPASANDGNGFIFRRQPEVADFQVGMVNVRLLDPEGRILGRLSFDPAHGEIPAVHPDASPEEKLAGNFRLDGDHVRTVIRRVLMLEFAEIIIAGI